MRRKTAVICGLTVICALTAVTAALASSGSGHRSRPALRMSTQAAGEGAPPGGGWAAGPGGPHAVHSESVVLDKAGTGYITVTQDDGTLKSVDASQGTLTISEGTEKVPYKTVTLTIGSGATVTLDGKTSSLEKLAEGDHVSVTSSSEGTVVAAFDSSFHPEGPPPGSHGGPPPGGQRPAA